MIPDWQHNCVYLADLLGDRHPSLFTRLQDILLAHGIEVRVLTNVKDIWARDYCPIQVLPRTLVKFRYEPAYLRDAPELRTGDEILPPFRSLGRCNLSFVNLDGGNVVGSTAKAILTDVFLCRRANAGWDQARLQAEVQKLLHVEQLIVVPREPFDPIGHADALVRFVDEQTVLVNDYSEVDPAFGERLMSVLRRHELAIELLPYYYERKTRAGIPSAVGCYTNFLRTEKVLVAPVYGTCHDQLALKKLESVFTGLPSVPLNCTALAREGGVLNCVCAGYRLA